MEVDEYSGYLKFASDTGEVSLSENFSEPIFTEINATEWPNDTFPILSFISEDCTTYETPSLEDTIPTAEINENINIELVNDENGTANIILNDEILGIESAQNEIPENSVQENFIQENVAVENSIQTIDENVNYEPTTLSYITYTTSNDLGAPKTTSDSYIPIINEDGSIFLIQQSPPSNSVDLKDFFSSVIANKCNICGFLSESEDDIKAHVQKEHSDLLNPKIINPNSLLKSSQPNVEKKTVFLCGICKNTYSDRDQLKAHMIEKHNLKEIVCEKPPEKENSEEKIEKPVENQDIATRKAASELLIQKQKNAASKIKCSIKGCASRFANMNLRKQHEAYHVDGEKSKFQCKACDQKFTVWRVCCSHVWKCHNVDLGLLTCPMCNKFKSYSTVIMVRHLLVHDEVKPFLCSHCGNGFRQMAQLKNHEKMAHNRDSTIVPSWSKVIKCELCERYFSNHKSYKKHVSHVHEKIKPFICNICGHQTARKSMLQLHYRQHTGAKPHECEICDYKTRDHNSLRRHMMRHTGASMYSCPYCTYTSIQSQQYKAHLAAKHPEKDSHFRCADCAYTTVNPTSYASHLKLHVREKEQCLSSGLDKENVQTTASHKTDTLVSLEDDETQSCFLNGDTSEEAIDTGGITIPAGLEMQLDPS